MVTLLIPALVILFIIGIGLYFWQRPRFQNSELMLPPPPPDARGLFGDPQPLPNAETIDDVDAADELSGAAQRDEKAALAQAVISSWQTVPDRNTTSKALHFAALSDNAELYRTAVETGLKLWRAGRLPEVSAAELGALFDGEFWVLSSGTRSSGAGFVLKQTLADARRELEAATRPTQ